MIKNFCFNVHVLYVYSQKFRRNSLLSLVLCSDHTLRGCGLCMRRLSCTVHVWCVGSGFPVPRRSLLACIKCTHDFELIYCVPGGRGEPRYETTLGVLCLCVRVGHLGVWGELVNHIRSLTHHPSSQGWVPWCPIHFVFTFLYCT